MKRVWWLTGLVCAAGVLGMDVTVETRGEGLQTEALQKAVDAVSAAGGGTVNVPAGTWVTGTVELKDGVTLRVPEGCVLLGSTNRVDYRGGALVYAQGAKRIALEGRGTIDGRGAAFPAQENGRRWLPHLVNLFDCRDVRVEGVRLRNAGTWTLHPKRCDGVTIRGVDIFNHVNQCNDGLDISSRNVLIEDCVVDSDDDALVFKTLEPDIVVENVTVRNCRFASSCNFIKFGTETRGVTRNVTVEDCELFNPSAQAVYNWPAETPGCTNFHTGLAGLAFECVDGGVLENVTVRRVRGRGFHTPVFVRMGSRRASVWGGKPALRNILVEDCDLTAESRIACSVTGVPGEGLRPDGVTLRRVRLAFPGGGTEWDALRTVPEKAASYPECNMFDRQALPAAAFYVRHADNVRFERVTAVFAGEDARPELVLDDATGVTADAGTFARTRTVTAETRAADRARFRELVTRPDGWFACPPARADGKAPPLAVLTGTDAAKDVPEEAMSSLTARGYAVFLPFGKDLGKVLEAVRAVRGTGKIDIERVYLKGDGPGAALALRLVAAAPHWWTAANAVSLETAPDGGLWRVKDANVELVAGLRDPNLAHTLRAWNSLAAEAARFTDDEIAALVKNGRVPKAWGLAPFLKGYNNVGRPAAHVREDGGRRLILTATGRVGVFLPSFARMRTFTKRTGKLGPASEENLDPAWRKLLVRVRSSLDGTEQPCYFWAPPEAATRAVPLVAGLHTWSADYLQTSHYATVLAYARAHGWAMVGPNFRGPNSTPEGCGSDLAVRDVVDAVAYAKRAVKIDGARVYIVGGSGGGHLTLLMAGRHPEIFAGAAAFCPITDVARWHADSLLPHPGRGAHYAAMLEKACGGTPAERPEEYARRSPLTWLGRAAAAGLPVYIVTGIHDGWTGSVPVGHSFRAFNALAAPADRVDERDIAAVEETQRVPAGLAYDAARDGRDPFYGAHNKIHFRRTSRNVRFTLFEGGHGGNFAAGLDFLARQTKGKAADFTLPATGRGGEEALGK